MYVMSALPEDDNYIYIYIYNYTNLHKLLYNFKSPVFCDRKIYFLL